jgi:branched-chain amino acid transport system ATP-binding protein
VTPTLEISELRSGYAKKEVLRNVTFTVNEGDFVAIIGPNGSGKSTLVHTILKFVKPWSGRITFKGRDVTRLSPALSVRAGIGFCPTGGRVFPDLTVLENLRVGGFLLKDPALLRSRIDRAQGLFPVLRERAQQKAGTMSGGERQMLAIARALMLDPSLLILDEPSLGLAPIRLAEVLETLRSLNRETRVTVMLVEQNARAAFSVAQRALVMNLGQIVLDEPQPDIDRMHDRLAQVYMSAAGRKL